MENIRYNVFETNSSSSHSIHISENSDGILDTIVPDENGKIILHGGKFGWGPEDYNDALIKANYCATDLLSHIDNPNRRELLDMLVEVIKEHTGASEVIIDIDFGWDSKHYSYVDHQSVGTSSCAFENKSTLKNFIFNPESILHIDNDNYDDYSDYY